jgi:hypothetical protein
MVLDGSGAAIKSEHMEIPCKVKKILITEFGEKKITEIS